MAAKAFAAPTCAVRLALHSNAYQLIVATAWPAQCDPDGTSLMGNSMRGNFQGVLIKNDNAQASKCSGKKYISQKNKKGCDFDLMP